MKLASRVSLLALSAACLAGQARAQDSGIEIGKQAPAAMQIREFLADNPAAWKKAVQSKAFRDRFEFWGEALSRPPRGFDPNHELIEDIKRRNFAVGAGIPNSIVTSNELLPTVVDTFKRIAPMIDYLCAALELEF